MCVFDFVNKLFIKGRFRQFWTEFDIKKMFSYVALKNVYVKCYLVIYWYVSSLNMSYCFAGSECVMAGVNLNDLEWPITRKLKHLWYLHKKKTYEFVKTGNRLSRTILAVKAPFSWLFMNELQFTWVEDITFSSSTIANRNSTFHVFVSMLFWQKMTAM